MSSFNFTKMHALGNDFVIIDTCTQTVSLSQKELIAIANRKTGIGCDQILLISPLHEKTADFTYQIFNADGSEAEQCGNGARCVGAFLRRKKLSTQSVIRLQHTNGKITTVKFLEDGTITADLGEPTVQFSESFMFENKTYPLVALSLGNPHAVICMDNIDSIDLQKLATQVQQDPRFPNGVNVEIFEPTTMRMRVFERGVGETSSCGSGACAVAYAAFLQKKARFPMMLAQAGGEVTVDFHHTLWLSGPTTHVFDGTMLMPE